MADDPNPPGTNPSGGSKLREELNRLAEEGMRKVHELVSKGGELMKKSLEQAEKLYKFIAEKLSKSYGTWATDTKKVTEATEQASNSFTKYVFQGQKMGLVTGAIAGLLSGVFFGALEKVSSFISQKLAPDVEAITGGIAKWDEANRRVQISTQRLAVEVEAGQQRALSPFKDAVADVIERLTALNPVLVQQVAYYGQQASIVAKVAAAFFGASAAIAGYGVLLGQVLPLILDWGSKLTGVAREAVSLGSILSYVAQGGIAAFKEGIMGVVALLARFAVPVTVVVAALGILAFAWQKLTAAGEREKESLKERLERLAASSEQLRRVHEDYEMLAEGIEHTAQASHKLREAEAAFGRGDLAGGARLRDEVSQAEQLIRSRQRMLQLTRQLMDQHQLSRGEATKEAQELLREEEIENELKSIEAARQALARDRLEALSMGLQHLQREEALEQQLFAIEERRGQARQRDIAGRLQLAAAQGDNSKVIEISKELTEEALRERDIRLKSIEEQRKGIASQITAYEKGIKDQEVLLDRGKEAAERHAELAMAAASARRNEITTAQELERLTSAGGGETPELKQARMRHEAAQKTLAVRERELAIQQAGANATRGDVQQVENLKGAKAQLLAQDAALKQNAEEILQDRTLLYQQEQRLVALKQQQVALEQQAENARERFMRANGTFDAENAFARARSRFVMAFPLLNDEDVEKARANAERMMRLGDELGGRFAEQAARLTKKLANAQLSRNKELQAGVNDQIESLKQRLGDGVTTPLQAAAEVAAQISKNVSTWMGPMDEAIQRLKIYLGLYKELGGVVESAAGGPSPFNPPRTVEATPGGVNVTPPTSPSVSPPLPPPTNDIRNIVGKDLSVTFTNL